MTDAKKHRKLFIILMVTVIGMFGFGYAMVPLYNVFCKVTGINGRVFGAAEVQAVTPIDKSRTITVIFLATNNEQLPWEFRPSQTSVKIHPGEVTRVSYFAKNNSDNTMVVQAIPSVSPGLASKYLRKTECFCFTQQTLGPGESMDMPILFHLDSDLPKDMRTVTLSYTLFNTEITNIDQSKRGKL